MCCTRRSLEPSSELAKVPCLLLRLLLLLCCWASKEEKISLTCKVYRQEQQTWKSVELTTSFILLGALPRFHTKLTWLVPFRLFSHAKYFAAPMRNNSLLLTQPQPCRYGSGESLTSAGRPRRQKSSLAAKLGHLAIADYMSAVYVCCDNDFRFATQDLLGTFCGL